MEEIEVSIACERQSGLAVLEGRLRLPGSSAPAPGVVLCHPHPAGGGDMDVPLIRMMSEALGTLGAAVLRFNFAGVGNSRGFFTEGALEPTDVQHAFRFLQARPEVDPDNVSAAGWSFGALMALIALVDGPGMPAATLVAIAPPLAAYDWSEVATLLAGSRATRYYIVGEKDRYCPPATLREFASAVSPGDAENIIVLEGADHFLFGREQEVTRLLAEYL